MDHITAMITFGKVIETGSFSEAARRLGLSKSAVSKQVARLEDRLGARLINRTTRRTSVTEIGALLYERCARIAAEVEDAEQAVLLHASPRGVLKINAPVSFGHMHICPALPDFLAAYPDLEIELVLNDRFVDLVEEGYDMAVRVAHLPDSSLIARRLAPSRRIVCAAPAYVGRRGRPVAPADLAGHECLLYSNLPDAPWRLADGGGATEAVRVTGRLKANNGDALRALALAGAGVGLMPTFIIGEDVRAGRLVRLLDGWEDASAGVHAVYPHGRHLSPKIRVFIDFLAARFGPEPYWDAPAGAGRPLPRPRAHA
jgi:DNA-binding transcriptional LysR family regulator